MPKIIDLSKHKPQIASRYRLHSKVMVRYGTKTGGWVRIRDLSGKMITILRVNKKSLTAALRSGPRVSAFNIVTKGSFKVLPIIAEKLRA
jgi:hypothetical protein